MGGNSLSTSIKRRTEERIRQIVEFWNQLRVSEELGATTWDVLEPLERTVTDAFAKQRPDLVEADAATAKALFHIFGQENL
jgi:hypothetical protein